MVIDGKEYARKNGRIDPYMIFMKYMGGGRRQLLTIERMKISDERNANTWFTILRKAYEFSKVRSYQE